MSVYASEVASGERFEFGRNWARFLGVLTEERIAKAEESLREMLGTADLSDLSFVDAGCGSGLFSLAARRLGARVYSFDFDPQSVACARELKRRYFPGDCDWSISEGSVLDEHFLAGLGKFDIVYSWGVLHHTGAMWKALANAATLVAEGGKLFISLYNDAGNSSKRWRAVKRTYNHLPRGLRFLVLWPAAVQLWWRPMAGDLVRLHPFREWRAYNQRRGMSPWRDIVDWVGGYPYEVAKPPEIAGFYQQRGFSPERMVPAGAPLGCNQFIFRKAPPVEPVMGVDGHSTLSVG
jgi:2-polyprenyl-6-hydroxyphenyl methylase/3-demethylubiquinone-9 3-methyltransferase